MSPEPNPNFTLPIEILTSIFELVSPKTLALLTRCSRCFYDICNLLLYREVSLHTPTQLVALSASQRAMQMLGTVGSLVIGDSILYLEAWDSFNEPPNPFYYIVPMLRATTSLRTLKVVQSHTPITFSNRADWGEESRASELLGAASNPEFLPNLTLISVFSPSQTYVHNSWFEELCYDRVIECYSAWNDGSLHAKIFPALERFDAMAPRPQLSRLAISRLASHPKRDISGMNIGQMIWRSLDSNSRSNFTHFGLLIQLPDVTLLDKPSPIHNTFSWLKDVLRTAEIPQLQGLHVRFKSPPLDWAASLETQRLGLEELQVIVPALGEAGMSSTRTFWKRWVPAPGEVTLYPSVPHWAPCPAVDSGNRTVVRAMLTWWLNAMGLDTSVLQDRNVMKDLAKRLSAVMHERWGDLAPSETTLYDQFLNHFLLVDPSYTLDQ